MQLNITGHHLEITDAIRQFVSEKFAKLGKDLDRINQVNVTLSIEKVDHIAEATVFINGGELHASAQQEDMYAAIDVLIDKLARQLNKHKDKLKQH